MSDTLFGLPITWVEGGEPVEIVLGGYPIPEQLANQLIEMDPETRGRVFTNSVVIDPYKTWKENLEIWYG